MINMITPLSPFQIIISLIIGFLLAGAYCALLWNTAKTLSKVKHKVVFGVLSALARISMVVIVALLVSMKNVSSFLLIILGFIIMKSIIIKMTQKSVLKKGRRRR